MAFGWGTGHSNFFFIQVNDDEHINSINRINNKVDLYLLNYNLEYFPQNFTVTTNNGSFKFNIDLLKETSSVIKNAVQNNPNITEYHIDVNDNKNVMEKLRNLYQFKKVVFYLSDVIILQEITESLNIISCPSFMLPKKMQLPNSSVPTKVTIQIESKKLLHFLQSIPDIFTIVANGKEYQCNSLGVDSSKVIRDFRREKPEENRFILTYEDDDTNGFEIIQNLFNFQKVAISIDNANFLEKMADQLQIEFIISDIKHFVDSYENAAQLIDDKKVLINTIDEVFEWLFNIDKLTVETVTKNLLNSVWNQSEDDAKELTSCLLHVSLVSFSLQPFLIELLNSLAESEDENNHLKDLISFVKQRLLADNLHLSSNGSFIYKMYQKGLITIEDIENLIYKNGSISSALLWFYPEVIEKKIKHMQMNNHNVVAKFIQKYSIDEYKKMRDSGEPDDPITNAIFHDDVDQLQKLISSRKIDINADRIPFNIFDEIHINQFAIHNNSYSGKTFINYASERGSIKCFKYLFLNHANFDEDSMTFAIFGGNTEIIRTVDQNSTFPTIQTKNKSGMCTFMIGNFDIRHPLTPAVIKHKHDLFDWIVEEKNIFSGFELNIPNSHCSCNIDFMLILQNICSSSNAHALIGLFDKGLNIDNILVNNASFNYVIPLAGNAGFFRFMQLLLSFKSKNTEFSNPQLHILFNSVAYSGNLTLVKFIANDFLDLPHNKNLIQFDNSLINAVSRDHLNIVQYIIENLYQKNISANVKSIIQSSIGRKKSKMFYYIIDKLNLQNLISTNEIGMNELFSFINIACNSNNFEIVEKLTDIILLNEPKADFTFPFIKAVNSNADEICQFFIDKKVYLNISKIVKKSSVAKVSNGKVALYLICISNPAMKETFSQCFLNDAIIEGNKDLVESLLKACRPLHSSLIEAVKNHHLDIVKLILNINKKQSFINELSVEGTALNVAVVNEDLNIVKYLLSVPGIDPNLYDTDNSTPLTNAISRMNIDIINAFLDYFGESIQMEMWQINDGLKKMVGILSDYCIINKVKGENKKHRKSRQNNFLQESKDKVFAIVDRLIKIDNVNLNCHSSKYTLLSYACAVNDIELVKLLLSFDKINVNSYGPINGNTPLMIAIENKNVEIARLLIEFPKTNINAKNCFKKTALILAVDQNLDQVISYLINNPKFDPDESCLNHAFFISKDKTSHQLSAVKELNVNYSYINESSKNSSQINQQRQQLQQIQQQLNHNINKKYKSHELYVYETTLIHAINNKRADVVDLILNHPSFDPSESQLTSAIFVAVDTEQNEIADKLLKLIDNNVNIYNLNNQSLLSFSVMKQNENFVRTILESDTFNPVESSVFEAFFKAIHPTLNPQTNTNFNGRNNNGFGFGFGHWNQNQNQNLNDFISSIPIMNILLQFDENHTNILNFNELLPNGKSFFTILSCYIMNIDEVVRYFLDHNVDPNKPDKYGIFPLEHAIRLNSSAFVSELLSSERIDLKIRVKRGDVENETFLHLAARNDTLRCFLQADGVDVNVVDDKGETPLMKACASLRRRNVVELLKREDIDYKRRSASGEDALEMCKKSPFLVKNSYASYGFGSFGNQNGQFRNVLGDQAPEEKVEYYSKMAPFLKF